MYVIYGLEGYASARLLIKRRELLEGSQLAWNELTTIGWECSG
jgi:hypothetical protein